MIQGLLRSNILQFARACRTFFISHYFLPRLINLLQYIFCSMLVSKLGERHRQHLALLFQTSKLANNSTKGFQNLWLLITYKEEGGFLNTLLLKRVLIILFLPIFSAKRKNELQQTTAIFYIWNNQCKKLVVCCPSVCTENGME